MFSRTIDWRSVATLSVLGILLLLLWRTPIVYPLRLLTVFFHELSHGLAAIVTGGSIVGIQIVPAEGGLCVTTGGMPFLIASAGYLGSLLWGGAILIAAARVKRDRILTVILGLILFAVTLYAMRPLLTFGMLFGTIASLAFIAIGLYLPDPANDFLLKLIGLTSCLYAPADVFSDILARPGLPSDAHILAEITGIPSILWGLLWLGISLPVAGWFLIEACRRNGYPTRESISS
ncbi:MAG: M50 family metallopeptidase [Candidatus Hydrogenedentes bacterium]|nr:M50 family metallopeptidase [Candidatus Hydrogenedentota bacterium]